MSRKITDNDSVKCVWSTFKSGILNIANKNIPLNNRRPKSKLWITQNTVCQIRRRKRMWINYLSTPTDTNREIHNTQSKLCKTVVNKDYDCYLNKHICSKLDDGDTKPLYRFIANKQGSSNSIKRLDNCVNDSPIVIAESFADAFSSVFTEGDGSNLQPAPTMIQQQESVTFYPKGVLKQ